MRRLPLLQALILIQALVLGACAGGGNDRSGRPAKLQAAPTVSPSLTGITSTRTGRQPCALVVTRNRVWVSNYGSNTVVAVDPASLRVTSSTKVDSQPCGLTFGAGSVWVENYGANDVQRIDPGNGKLLAIVPVGPSPFDVKFGFGSVWVSNSVDETVDRISPTSNKVVQTIPVGAGPAGLEVAFRAGVGGECRRQFVVSHRPRPRQGEDREVAWQQDRLARQLAEGSMDFRWRRE
jgi:YVTN family beta-propeller protein